MRQTFSSAGSAASDSFFPHLVPEREAFVHDVLAIGESDRSRSCILMVRMGAYGEDLALQLQPAARALGIVGRVFRFDGSLLVIIHDSADAVRDSLLHIRSVLFGAVEPHWTVRLDVLTLERVLSVIAPHTVPNE